MDKDFRILICGINFLRNVAMEDEELGIDGESARRSISRWISWRKDSQAFRKP